jgi:predicted SprT family Zn-dependent metalloprotease
LFVSIKKGEGIMSEQKRKCKNYGCDGTVEVYVKVPTTERNRTVSLYRCNKCNQASFS